MGEIECDKQDLTPFPPLYRERVDPTEDTEQLQPGRGEQTEGLQP